MRELYTRCKRSGARHRSCVWSLVGRCPRHIPQRFVAFLVRGLLVFLHCLSWTTQQEKCMPGKAGCKTTEICTHGEYE